MLGLGLVVAAVLGTGSRMVAGANRVHVARGDGESHARFPHEIWELVCPARLQSFLVHALGGIAGYWSKIAQRVAIVAASNASTCVHVV